MISNKSAPPAAFIHRSGRRGKRKGLIENLRRKPLTDPEVAVAVNEYDKLKRKLEGSARGGTRTDLGHSMAEVDGWTQEKTAEDLGISQPAVNKAIQIATAIEEYPELATKKGPRMPQCSEREGWTQKKTYFYNFTEIVLNSGNLFFTKLVSGPSALTMVTLYPIYNLESSFATARIK